MTTAGWTSGPVVLGCGSFGGIGGARDLIGKGLDEAASLEALDAAAGVGITMLDTAERYAAGFSETVMGRWLAESDPSVTRLMRVTTKVAPGNLSGQSAPFDVAFIEPAVDASLRRLGLDHVEWLLTHAPDDATPIEVTLEALESIRSSGRCRHVGGCNLDVRQLDDALSAAERLGITGYELVQNGHSLLQPDGDAEVRRACAERGLAYVAFSPLAGGVLTGKYRRGERPAPGTRLDLRPEGFDEMLTPSMFAALDELARHAAELGVSTGALALAWLIHSDDVTALITGPARTAPYVGLAAEAMRVELTADLADRLTDLFRSAAR
ncbi:MAG TPA: aldo/keto reductase [Acidimicrobiales bacterium]